MLRKWFACRQRLELLLRQPLCRILRADRRRLRRERRILRRRGDLLQRQHQRPLPGRRMPARRVNVHRFIVHRSGMRRFARHAHLSSDGGVQWIPRYTRRGTQCGLRCFGIERIDNSFGTTTFNFDPANLFVQQAGADFFDSGLAIYTKLFGPFAITPQTLTAGDDRSFAPVAQGATIVSTANIDGSTEANQTSYLLQYKRQPADPPILFVKSNVLTTSFPNTEDCTTIVLK